MFCAPAALSAGSMTLTTEVARVNCKGPSEHPMAWYGEAVSWIPEPGPCEGPCEKQLAGTLDLAQQWLSSEVSLEAGRRCLGKETVCRPSSRTVRKGVWTMAPLAAHGSEVPGSGHEKMWPTKESGSSPRGKPKST